MKKDVHVSIDEDVWKRAKKKCVDEGRNLSEVVEEFLQKWIKDK